MGKYKYTKPQYVDLHANPELCYCYVEAFSSVVNPTVCSQLKLTGARACIIITLQHIELDAFITY